MAKEEMKLFEGFRIYSAIVPTGILVLEHACGWTETVPDDGGQEIDAILTRCCAHRDRCVLPWSHFTCEECCYGSGCSCPCHRDFNASEEEVSRA